MSNRRQFMIQVSTGTGAVACGSVFAAETVKVTELGENEPTAKALGYIVDATKTDKKKYPKYATGQNCTTCALFQPKTGDKKGVTVGGCPLFAGKQVSVTAWCSAYAKKA